MLKKISGMLNNYIFSDKLDFNDKIINMVCVLGLIASIFATVTRLIISRELIMLFVMTGVVFIIIVLIYVRLKFKIGTQIQSFSIFMIVGFLGDVLFPITFFALGGINSGMPLYFLLSIVTILIMLHGKMMIIALVIHLSAITACFLTDYYDIIPVADIPDTLTNALDIAQSLVVTSIFIGGMIICLKRIYVFERKKAVEANKNLLNERISLDAILDSNTQVSVLISSEMKVIECDKAAVEFFGFSDKEALLSNLLERAQSMIPAYQPDGRASRTVMECIESVIHNGYENINTDLHTSHGIRTINATFKKIPFRGSFAIVMHLTDNTELLSARADLISRDKLLRVGNRSAVTLLSSDVESLNDALTKTMRRLASAIDIDRFIIWRTVSRDGKQFYKQAYTWISDTSEFHAYTLIPGEEEGEMVARPVWDDLFRSNGCLNGIVAEFDEETQKLFKKLSVKSVLGIPILIQEEFWGFISLDDCRTERVFSDDEIEILRTIGLMLASTINRTESSKLLGRRLKQQELTSVIAQNLISADDMGRLIENALKMVGEFLNTTRILIAVAEKDSDNSHPMYNWVSSEKWIPDATQDGFNEIIFTSFPRKIPKTDFVPTIICNDIMTEADGKYKIFEKVDLKSFIWAPLYVNGEYYGMLSIEECVSKRVWNESEAQLVSIVSSAIDGAIARDLMDRERVAALNHALSASQAKGNFLSNMSHEMRTPMNAIIGMTAIGKAAGDIERKDYAFKKIEDASNHLLGVINDILDMSKIEADKLELNPVTFNFEKMMRKVVDVINFRVDERHQTLHVALDKHIPEIIRGDDQRLAQIIANLLSNAVKFTPEEGTITLTAKLLSEADKKCLVQISVKDSGIGLTQDQMSRLFNSFEQADSGTARKFGGTGLGLAISKRLVTMMNGDISVNSELRNGATFTFTAELTRVDGVPNLRHNLIDGVNWKDVTILAIDDDPIILKYFQEITSRFGIFCDTAESGAKGLEMIKLHGEYSIYFVDLRMPIMDGLEFARVLHKTTENDEDLQIVLISGSEWSTIEEEARAAGVNRFISKPLFPSSLVDLLNEVFGIRELTSDDEGELDDFSSYTLLLAEDVDINREIVSALLEPTKLNIVHAENGKEALDLFASEPDKYDMIFMDVQMPEMDGYDATKAIRAMDTDKSRNIPIVAMTANVFKEDIEKCLASGMNAHVGKPLDFDEVLTILRNSLIKSS
ncbi:hypothetical protein FACS1894105_08620 [Clostridia bacterium]|nr:hypothetical protein FACS1894105_08620 [Clostridia bacterium]